MLRTTLYTIVMFVLAIAARAQSGPDPLTDLQISAWSAPGTDKDSQGIYIYNEDCTRPKHVVFVIQCFDSSCGFDGTPTVYNGFTFGLVPSRLNPAPGMPGKYEFEGVCPSGKADLWVRTYAKPTPASYTLYLRSEPNN